MVVVMVVYFFASMSIWQIHSMEFDRRSKKEVFLFIGEIWFFFKSDLLAVYYIEETRGVQERERERERELFSSSSPRS